MKILELKKKLKSDNPLISSEQLAYVINFYSFFPFWFNVLDFYLGEAHGEKAIYIKLHDYNLLQDNILLKLKTFIKENDVFGYSYYFLDYPFYDKNNQVSYQIINYLDLLLKLDSLEYRHRSSASIQAFLDDTILSLQKFFNNHEAGALALAKLSHLSYNDIERKKLHGYLIEYNNLVQSYKKLYDKFLAFSKRFYLVTPEFVKSFQLPDLLCLDLQLFRAFYTELRNYLGSLDLTPAAKQRFEDFIKKYYRSGMSSVLK